MEASSVSTIHMASASQASTPVTRAQTACQSQVLFGTTNATARIITETTVFTSADRATLSATETASSRPAAVETSASTSTSALKAFTTVPTALTTLTILLSMFHQFTSPFASTVMELVSSAATMLIHSRSALATVHAQLLSPSAQLTSLLITEMPSSALLSQDGHRIRPPSPMMESGSSSMLMNATLIQLSATRLMMELPTAR